MIPWGYVVQTCLAIIRLGKDLPARHCEESKKKGRRRKRWEDMKWTELDRQSLRAVRKTDRQAADCEIIGGAHMTLWVRGHIDR